MKNKRKLTLQEKQILSDERSLGLRRKKKSKHEVDVEVRFIGKNVELGLLQRMRSWHKHGSYKTIEDAEKAVAILNQKDGFQYGTSPKKRLYEYRLKPQE